MGKKKEIICVKRKVLLDKRKIMERWREFFRELLATGSNKQPDDL